MLSVLLQRSRNPGGKVLTILDLQDVYMTIFLPAATAGRLEIGSEARIILDPFPQYVIPAIMTLAGLVQAHSAYLDRGGPFCDFTRNEFLQIIP